MTVKKTIQNEMNSVYEGFNKLSDKILEDNSNVRISLAGFADKLDTFKSPRWLRRVTSVRNWLTHFLLWVILALLLSSCFVSGRTITFTTPRVEITADTATAFTWPYNSHFQ